MSSTGHAPPVRALTALSGGILSVLASAAQLLWMARGEGRNIDVVVFFEMWSLVFVGALASHVLFVWRRHESVFSRRRQEILRAFLPGLLTGAAIGACLSLTTGLPLLPAVFWLLFYGLALTGAVRSAPASVVALGWIFLLSGIAVFYYLMYETIMPEFDLPTPTRYYPAGLMGLGFGVCHLVYAACTWRGQTADPREDDAR